MIITLTVNLPDHHLIIGDIGTVLDWNDDQTEFEVEFMTLHGETLATLTLHHSQVRMVGPHEIAHARPIDR